MVRCISIKSWILVWRGFRYLFIICWRGWFYDFILLGGLGGVWGSESGVFCVSIKEILVRVEMEEVCEILRSCARCWGNVGGCYVVCVTD